MKENMPGSVEFSKDYFEGGKQVSGAYSSYDEARLKPAFEDMVRELKNSLPVKQVLDIGCAKGFLVAALQSAGFTAYGTDISEYAISQAPAALKAYLQVADLGKQRLSFTDSFFDGIICMGTLEYIADQELAINEIDRILMPGGYLLVTTLNSVPPNDRYRIYAKGKSHWDRVFAKKGYEVCHELAARVLSRYVRKVIRYDLRRGLNQAATQKQSLKVKLAKLLVNVGMGPVIEKYLYSKQMQSGYLMLGYQKKK